MSEMGGKRTSLNTTIVRQLFLGPPCLRVKAAACCVPPGGSPSAGRSANFPKAPPLPVPYVKRQQIEGLGAIHQLMAISLGPGVTQCRDMEIIQFTVSSRSTRMSRSASKQVGLNGLRRLRAASGQGFKLAGCFRLFITSARECRSRPYIAIASVRMRDGRLPAF